MVGKKKRVVKKRAVVKSKPSFSSSKVIFSKFKFGIVLRNLILFVLLALISWILSYYVFESGVFADLFYLLLIIFGFISLAFFIALLVLLFLKWIKR
jgi:hypothetical protein